MMRSYCLAAALAVICCVGLPASLAVAQQAPGPDDLAASLNLGMPPWWGVVKVDIQASVNDGDEISPKYRQRFTADVAPREDLFQLVDEIEPFSVVAVVTPAGKPHRLYGIGSSTLTKGQWSTTMELENSVGALGEPQSLFDGPVVVAGAEGSQQAIEAFMQGRETAKALAERAARTAANADILARLAAEADAQERALLEDTYRRRLEALKGRIDADLAGFASAVDAMVADNQKILAQLKALQKEKIAAMKASAETQLALAEAKKENEAQDELASALEALAVKRQRSIDLEVQAAEARLAAGKKRYDHLRTKLASADGAEQLAAFDAVMASEDESLRPLAFTAAFRSGNDDLQGMALAAYIAGMPQMSISVDWNLDGQTGTYVQTLRITEVNGASFAGELSTPWKVNEGAAKVTGTIRSDSLSLDALWPDNQGQCSWHARIDEQGVLNGQMDCSKYGGRRDSNNPGGEASVSF